MSTILTTDTASPAPPPAHYLPPPVHPPAGHVERVTVEADAAGEMHETMLTGRQWAALALTAGVFLLIAGITTWDFTMLRSQIPPPPAAPSQLTKESVELYQALTAHYTSVVGAAQERAIQLFDRLIAVSLLPVFTGMIGFIVGRERP